MEIFKLIIWIAFGYLLGSVPTGVIIAKIAGKDDPRKSGSGNIGATNVARTMGNKLGLVTLACDLAKGFFPAYLAQIYLEGAFSISLAALSPVLGHMFSVYLKFKGGKGVATGLGIFLALSPFYVIPAILVFAFTLLISGYVSLGSILGSVSLPLIIFFGEKREFVPVAAVVAFLIVIKHRENIKRIAEGKEGKFFKGKQKG